MIKNITKFIKRIKMSILKLSCIGTGVFHIFHLRV